MSYEAIETALSKFSQTQTLQLADASGWFAPLVPEILHLREQEFFRRLNDWYSKYPQALCALLKDIGRNRLVSAVVARWLLQDLFLWDGGERADIGDAFDSIFSTVFYTLPDPDRHWIAERPGVRSALQLKENIDYFRTRLSQSEIEFRWPQKTPLPRLDSNLGIKVRLVRLGYHPGALDEQWDEHARVALLRFQTECAAPRVDTPDEFTRALIVEELGENAERD